MFTIKIKFLGLDVQVWFGVTIGAREWGSGLECNRFFFESLCVRTGWIHLFHTSFPRELYYQWRWHRLCVNEWIFYFKSFSLRCDFRLSILCVLKRERWERETKEREKRDMYVKMCVDLIYINFEYYMYNPSTKQILL